jgi:NTE family protein
MIMIEGDIVRKSRLGLALGSGAARGFAHIGVLKAFEQEGIAIDYISGCSIGSIIGALYCSGISLDRIEQVAKEIEPWKWIDVTVPRMGLILGKKIEDTIKKLTDQKRFDQLDIPLSIVATNLCNGEKVVFTEGYVYKAVRASIAIPGIFAPAEHECGFLADGGLVDPVPVELVRQMGADVVIGVNLGSKTAEKNMRNIYDVIIQSIDIMQNEIIRSRGIAADLLINPDLRNINAVNFNQVGECIEIGIEAARQSMDSIKELLNKRRGDRLDWLRNLARRGNLYR